MGFEIALPPRASAWRRRSIISSIDGQAFATVGVRLLIVAGGFVSSVLTARWLSPSGRGEYFLIVTLAQTIAQFGTCGLQSSNTYLVARNRALAAPLLANSLWLSLLVGGGGSALVIFALRRTGLVVVDATFWFVGLLAPATLFFMLGSNLLVGMRRIGSFNTFQLGSSYGVLLCVTGAAAVGAGPNGFLAASALAWTSVSWVLLLIIRQDVKGSLAFNRRAFSEGFRYASKAYIAALSMFLVVRINVFLLSALKGVEQVGYYSVASQIADVIGIVPQSMALVLFPTLIMATEGRFKTTLRNLVVVGLLVATGCGLVAVFAEPFVRLVFGSRFLETVPVLRGMMPGVLFLGLTAILSQYLAAAGFPLSLVAIWVGGSVMASTLGWLLIPVSSGVGAAIAMSLTHATIFVAVLIVSLRHARRAVRSNRLPLTVKDEAVS
jgi:O-antigen/teichoic acid export membrane protein